MNLSKQDQAILLLTVTFGKNDQKTAKPLSRSEWSRFAIWLNDHELKPSSLLNGDVHSQLSDLVDKSVSADRVHSLLGRGTTLGLALEKWQRAGIWAITRSDPDYPKRLLRRLGADCPAVLFGSGEKKRLQTPGIAVVGSRDANSEDLAFTENMGRRIASQGYSVVSGGARGVDQCAMLGALNDGGTALGVMADGLLKASTSAKFRSKIMSGDLVLVTPFNPEAGFNVGNAMARNRYIYCLADAAVVISSTTGKGGTWNGAMEDLKAGWVPLWVSKSSNPKSGNSDLVNKGASWLPDGDFTIKELTDVVPAEDQKSSSLPLLDARPPEPLPDLGPEVMLTNRKEEPKEQPGPSEILDPELTTPSDDLSLFDLFVAKMQRITVKEGVKTADICTKLELNKSQVSIWLKRGVEEGKIKKFLNPVRYQSIENSQTQGTLL
jgi:predicted Rossmann fold nucleotide-binding protein DprA/Smf involved in DNA uptake